MGKRKEYYNLLIILAILLSAYPISASPPKDYVYYLFQSAIKKNETKLVVNEDINILFVNENCDCFSRLAELEKFGNNYVVVTFTKNWNQINLLSKKSPGFKKLFYDPGGRFFKSLGSKKIEATFLRISNGKVTKRHDFVFSPKLDNPYTLGIWEK